MRIVLISGDYPPTLSGVGDYTAHLAVAFRTLGQDAQVVTSALPSDQATHKDPDWVHRVVRRWAFSDLGALSSAVQNADVAIIQYNCPFAYRRNPAINLLPAWIRMVEKNAIVLVSMHGFWEQSRLFRLRTTPMLRFAHGVVYVDRKNRRLLQRYSGADEGRMKYIPIASNIQPVSCDPACRGRWRGELGLAPDDIGIVFFGGIGKNKGLEELLQAISMAGSQHVGRLKVFIAGSPGRGNGAAAHLRKLEEICNALEPVARGSIIRAPGPEEVSRILHAADIAVFAFLQGVGENSGSMHAALAHGLPTVIAAGPANDPSFENAFGVKMYPAGRPDLLSGVLLRIISDIRAGKTQYGSRNVRDHRKEWFHIAEEYQGFIDTLRQQPQQPGALRI